MNRRLVVLLLFLSFSLIIFAVNSHACDRGPMSLHKVDLEKMFLQRTHLLYKYKDELQLTEDQISKIKKLSLDIKKGLIRNSAELEVIELDMQGALMEEDIDTALLGSLIDNKNDVLKEKSKLIVSTYEALNEILTAEQISQITELRQKNKDDIIKGLKMRQEGRHHMMRSNEDRPALKNRMK